MGPPAQKKLVSCPGGDTTYFLDFLSLYRDDTENTEGEGGP